MTPAGAARVRLAPPEREREVALATVVVLAGGTSGEREVSLASGRVVAAALADRDDARDARGPARVLAVEIAADGRWLVEGARLEAAEALARLPSALFFLALHGGDGEDGTLQGFLALARRAHTGSGVGASALCMDKHATRLVLSAAGLAVAPGVLVGARAWAEARAELLERALSLGARWYVKPNAGGSSVGTRRVERQRDLAPAIEAVLAEGDAALVEAAVEGVEATCGVIGNHAAELFAPPPVEIVPHAGRFFDYEQKYSAAGAAEHCPARGLAPRTVERLRELALTAHRAARCDGYSRTDFIVPRAGGGAAHDAHGEPVALEINTLPGLTERSLLPQSMHAAGFSYRDMCLAILALALDARRAQAPRGAETT
jgi:D-alanine-D-alanine ligase